MIALSYLVIYKKKKITFQASRHWNDPIIYYSQSGNIFWARSHTGVKKRPVQTALLIAADSDCLNKRDLCC